MVENIDGQIKGAFPKLIPVIVIALISCASYKPVSLDLSMLLMEGEGSSELSGRWSSCKKGSRNGSYDLKF